MVATSSILQQQADLGAHSWFVPTLCTRDTWLDVHERFNAPADLATARLTAVGDIALKSLPGWEPEMEVPDLLHTLWTGTGRDLIGSLCLHSIETSASYTGSTYDERLRQLRRDMQAWCMEHGIRPSTVEELSALALSIAAFLNIVSGLSIKPKLNK